MEPLRLLTQCRDVSGATAYAKDRPEFLLEGPAGSGKSRGALETIDQYCVLFPGIRVLICRQTLSSLRESVQVTLEDNVWWPGHPCITASMASREHRSGYTYPEATNVVGGVTYSGKSHIVLGGLDKPERTFSTEYDIVFVEEAIEVTKDAWEKLLRVNRNWKMPWQFILACTNPGAAFHWLNRRADEMNEATGLPMMRRLLSRHKDNPCLWDIEAEEWTEAGRDYLENKLGHMSGTTRAHLLEGRWVSESGLVYDRLDMAIHAVEAKVGRRKDGEIVVRDAAGDHVINQVVGAMDFGYRNPGSLSMYGKDTSGYWWHLVQVYRSQKLEEWWAGVFAGLYKTFRPSIVVADAASPGLIKALNVRIGRTDANPIVRKADKDFEAGRDCVDQLLQTDELGIPGIRFIRNNIREGVDTFIQGQGKPCCTLEEIQSYVWEDTPDGKADKERPKKENDHGMDELRYFARHVLTADYGKKADQFKFKADSYGHILKGHRKRLRQERRRKQTA